jgi:hypothetical protein
VSAAPPRLANQPTNQSINQPTNQSSNQPTRDHLFARSCRQTATFRDLFYPTFTVCHRSTSRVIHSLMTLNVLIPHVLCFGRPAGGLGGRQVHRRRQRELPVPPRSASAVQAAQLSGQHSHPRHHRGPQRFRQVDVAAGKSAPRHHTDPPSFPCRHVIHTTGLALGSCSVVNTTHLRQRRTVRQASSPTMSSSDATVRTVNCCCGCCCRLLLLSVTRGVSRGVLCVRARLSTATWSRLPAP